MRRCGSPCCTSSFASSGSSPRIHPRPTFFSGGAMAERAKAVRTAIEDNPRVAITEWRFAPGAETGWHRHPLDYVVVYRTAGLMRVETKDGASPVVIAEGAS